MLAALDRALERLDALRARRPARFEQHVVERAGEAGTARVGRAQHEARGVARRRAARPQRADGGRVDDEPHLVEVGAVVHHGDAVPLPGDERRAGDEPQRLVAFELDREVAAQVFARGELHHPGRPTRSRRRRAPRGAPRGAADQGEPKSPASALTTTRAEDEARSSAEPKRPGVQLQPSSVAPGRGAGDAPRTRPRPRRAAGRARCAGSSRPLPSRRPRRPRATSTARSRGPSKLQPTRRRLGRRALLGGVRDLGRALHRGRLRVRLGVARGDAQERPEETGSRPWESDGRGRKLTSRSSRSRASARASPGRWSPCRASSPARAPRRPAARPATPGSARPPRANTSSSSRGSSCRS